MKLRHAAARSALLLTCLGLSGCATSRLTAFRDPAYAEARFSKIAVFAMGMTLENSVEVEQQICRRLSPLLCISGKTVLPPTRQYADAEALQRITESGADGVLIVSLVSDEASSHYIGTVTNSEASAVGTSTGQVNLYGNQGYWTGSSAATARSTSVSTPVYGQSRHARALLGLYESKSGNIAWGGEITTTGNGALTVGNSEFIRSATSEIASELKNARLIGRGPRTNEIPVVEQRSDAQEVTTENGRTPLYELPAADSRVVQRVRRNTALSVVGASDGWYKVEFDGISLFVRATDVRLTK